MSDIALGRLIEGEANRDAIHVAIFPAVAHERLHPGQHVGLTVRGNTEQVGHSSEPIGIVDPFLTHPVPQGERCYVCLYPLTVTGMRHHWEHPAFTSQPGPEPLDLSKDQEVIQYFATQCETTYEQMIEAATDYARNGDSTSMGSNDAYTDVSYSEWPKFWRSFERVTGIKADDAEGYPFRCAC